MPNYNNKTAYSLSVSELVHETYSYGYTDPVLFDNINTKLQRFYEKTTNFKKLEQATGKVNNFPRGTKRASNNFKFKSGFSKPRVDQELKLEISKFGKHTLPISYKMPEYADVYKSDVDCLQRYSKPSKDIKRSNLRHFVIAGIHAAEHMDLLCAKGDALCSTTDVESAVLNTTKNTNSGYPLFKKKNDIVNIKDTNKWLKGILNEGTSFRLFKNSLMENPEVIFNRFQPILSENLETLEMKIRQVWCIPHRIVALEEVFFGKLLTRHKSKQLSRPNPVVTSGLNNKSISVKCVKRLRNAFGSPLVNNYKMYSLDYSKFDSTIPDFAIDIFFSICRRQINLSPKQSKIYELLRFYTKRSPFQYCGGYGFQKRGISSGSLITSTFDSWWNLTLWYLARTISNVNDDNIHSVRNKGTNVLNDLSSSDFQDLTFRRFDNIVVCGDDVLCVCNESIIKSHELLSRSIGMKCTVYKVAEVPQDDVFFLGRYWNKNNEPYQTDNYITAHIISRTKWYNKDDVDFDISEHLNVNRILSICCPLSNGPKYLNKYFKNYPPLQDFLNDDNQVGYQFLKDWHNESNSIVPKDRLSDWSIY